MPLIVVIRKSRGYVYGKWPYKVLFIKKHLKVNSFERKMIGKTLVMYKNMKNGMIIIVIMHYGDVIMGAIAYQITSLTIVYSTFYWDADQRKHQSSASLAFVWGIHRDPHKWPVTRKMFPFDDVIMGNWDDTNTCFILWFVLRWLCIYWLHVTAVYD